MSSKNSSSLTSSQIEDEESILSFYVAEDDVEIDDDILEVITIIFFEQNQRN